MQKAMEQMASDPQVYETLKQVLKTHVGWTSNGGGKWIERLAAVRNSQESVNIRYVRVRYVLASGRTVHRKYLVDYDKDNVDEEKLINTFAEKIIEIFEDEQRLEQFHQASYKNASRFFTQIIEEKWKNLSI